MFNLILTFVTLLHYGLCDLECYDCTSVTGPSQDDDCVQDGYSGHTTSYSSWQSCLTETHTDGSVRRYGSTIAMEDGECMGFGNTMTCYCTTALCNNNLCQDCGVDFTTTPKPPTTTPGMIETTTMGSTDITDETDGPTNATVTGTTDQPGSTSTARFSTTLKTTIQPGEGLSCYVCVDCPVIDENTDVIQNEDYESCVTTIALSGNFIIRGGDHEAHPDGDCIHEEGGMVCFCQGDLCNDDSYDVV